MLEKLSHSRVFLYEKKDHGSSTKAKPIVTWIPVKRLQKIRTDLDGDSGYLRVLSPSFKSYLDVDLHKKKFIVRDTLSGNRIYKISKGLMSLDEGEHEFNIVSRF